MPRRRGGGDEDSGFNEAPGEGEVGAQAHSDAEAMELADEDRLPWLEAVEEEDEESGPSLAKLVAAIVIGLAAIGLIVGGVFWLGNRGGPAGGDGELIAAPEGEYKIKPSDPGGMNVAGAGDTAFAASQGAQPKGRVNADGVPEAPVTPQRPAAATPQGQAQPRAPAQPAPRPAPAAPQAGGGATIQLGAFSSQAAATRAWTGLAARFRYLAPLAHNVVPATVGGRTVYRLRASGAGSADVCRRLRVAGEDCSVVS